MVFGSASHFLGNLSEEWANEEPWLPARRLRKGLSSSRSHQWRLVDEGGQSNVTLGQSPAVMCAEGDLDLQWCGKKRQLKFVLQHYLASCEQLLGLRGKCSLRNILAPVVINRLSVFFGSVTLDFKSEPSSLFANLSKEVQVPKGQFCSKSKCFISKCMSNFYQPSDFIHTGLMQECSICYFLFY